LNLIGFKKGIKFGKMIGIVWFSVRSLFAGATRKRKVGDIAGLPATPYSMLRSMISSMPLGLRIMAFFLCGFAGYQWFGAGVIAGKAWLAPILIEAAWERRGGADTTQERWDTLSKPWPWADTYPVAKLTILRRAQTGVELIAERYILKGADMAALAFGPVRLEGQSEGIGADIIFGHRDTHFAVLENIQRGDYLRLETRLGQQIIYQVRDMWVTHMNRMYAPVYTSAHIPVYGRDQTGPQMAAHVSANAIQSMDVDMRADVHTGVDADIDMGGLANPVRGLMLVTCYPFGGAFIPGQPPEDRYMVWAEPVAALPGG
jgi:sortase (surface protein transpeptidase)